MWYNDNNHKGNDVHADTQKNTPELALWGVFPHQRILGFVGLLFFSLVKPLAYVVTNYTCHNGDNKGDDVSHAFHLLPIGRSRHLHYTILLRICQYFGKEKTETVFFNRFSIFIIFSLP